MENNNEFNNFNNSNDEQNKKKFVIAAVLCLTLIFIIGGVSYAFLSYTRTGAKENIIQTGDIEVVYEDGAKGIDITNAYPISDADSNNDALDYTFKVIGHVTGNNTVINYNIYAVEGDIACTGTYTSQWDCSYYTQNTANYYRNRFNDYDMKLQLTGTPPTGSNDTMNILNTYTSRNILALEKNALANVDDNNNTGLVIANGTFTSDTRKEHIYNLRVWISSDLVQIQNYTDTFEEYTESSVYTWGGVAYNHYTITHYKSSDYAKLYYSLKINVRAVA